MNLNNHLTKFSRELFISHKSLEKQKVNTSVKTMKSKLGAFFGDKIDEVMLFGSYSRGTILPRKYDEKSDVDIMVMFNTEDYDKKNPETYRSNLKTFAKNMYPRQGSYKDLPSIIVELNNIKFDLVPAVSTNGWFWGQRFHVPDSGNEWQETDPKGFNDDLTSSNTKYDSIVKPIIRLMKYWNASVGYPYDSYLLEQEIAGMNFKGDNIESGFYYAIEELNTRGETEKLRKKVETLQKNIEWVKEYLEREDMDKAVLRMNKVLPSI